MKRRSFFQSLAAVAGALVLPKAKEVEADVPGEFDHPLESEPTIGIMSATEPPTAGDLWVDKSGSLDLNFRPGSELMQRGNLVYLDDNNNVRPIDKQDRPIFGVVDSCVEDPNGGYLANVITKGWFSKP